MAKQMNWLTDVWQEQYDNSLMELIMTTNIARLRVTIAHVRRELEREVLRYGRLKTPQLKRDSGVRISMLKDRIGVHQKTLTAHLQEKGYLAKSNDIPF